MCSSQAKRVDRAGGKAHGLARPVWHVGTVVVALMTAWVCMAFDLQHGAVITLDQFRTQGQSDNGDRWQLSGKQAVIRGTVYTLRDVTLTLDGEDGRSIVVRSPECMYRQDTGLIESDAAVRVEGGDLVLDGVGYDILIAERRLRVRDKVRMQVSAARTRVAELSHGPREDALRGTDEGRGQAN